ncbi:hypothetical protein B0H14DRAFT_3085140 [Mycena olivaceomarginata]|nr:hypothetical protein B0H14DRAFT_3085140 [Mycena olivaceomarginata]
MRSSPPPQYEPTPPAGTGTFPPPIRGNKPMTCTPTDPPCLHILGATWGGIIVTRRPSRSTCARSSTSSAPTRSPTGTRRSPCCTSTPTPRGHVPALHLGAEHIRVHLAGRAPAVHAPEAGGMGEPACDTGVEILAVLWGGHRIGTPSVLAELARFFNGEHGQIRMTNNFFKCDPWYNTKKTWVVYFRFAGHDSEKVQVVTGVEDGALEVPWSRP